MNFVLRTLGTELHHQVTFVNSYMNQIPPPSTLSSTPLSKRQKFKNWLHKQKTKEKKRTVLEGVIFGTALSIVGVLAAPVLGIGALVAAIGGRITGSIIAAKNHRKRKTLEYH